MLSCRIASVSLFVIIAAGTTACGPATPSSETPADVKPAASTAEPAPTTSAGAAPTAAPAAPSAAAFAPINQALASTLSVPAQLVIQVDQVTGDSAERARAIFAPTRDPIQKHCAPGSTGAMRVKVKSESGAVRMSVEPGSSLTGPMRRCVLEALSTVGVDDLHGYPNNAARPTGFSSLITVSW